MTEKNKKDFECELISKLLGKDLSETTVSYYMRNLRKLNNDKEITSLNFLNDKENVTEYLKDKKPNTQRNYYITVTSILGTDPRKKELKKYYTAKMDAMNTELKQKESLNEKSDTQKANWIEESKIKEIYNNLKNEVMKFEKQKNLTENKYNILLDYVVLSLYTLIPPRRNKDYQDAFMVYGISDKEFDADYNYIDMQHKKLIFNNFKTKKKEGAQQFDMPADLYDVLMIYKKHHPLLEEKDKEFEVPFLVNFEGVPLSNVNSLTYLLNRIFKKKIGCSMLRHLYLSNKYGNTINEQEKDAKMMAHSVSMQKDYIKK